MFRRIIKKIPGSKRAIQFLRQIPRQSDDRRFLLKRLPKRSVGAEIGVHLGDFSQAIIECISPKELHLIDPWEHQSASAYHTALYGGRVPGGQLEMDERYLRVLKRFDKRIRSNRVCIHRGYSTDVLQLFPDEYLDWIYIDGNHLYEYVKEDLELSLKKVKVGGYITGDDYQEGDWWGDGVKRAVDEFGTNKAVRLVEIRNRQFMFRKEKAI